MAYHYHGRRSNSIFDAFTLNPLPYPVLAILALVSIFLGISGLFSYEEMVEATEEQTKWVLLVIPLVILFIVRWLSSMDNPDSLFAKSPWELKRRTHHRPPPEGVSPWGVAALIVLLLVLVQFQSAFLDSWF